MAKHHAGNKVDVILYAVEKSLDAYKFGLLHNKQLFIRQLKTNNMGSRTIDEGVRSGIAVGFDPEQHLRTLKMQRKNG